MQVQYYLYSVWALLIQLIVGLFTLLFSQYLSKSKYSRFLTKFAILLSSSASFFLLIGIIIKTLILQDVLNYKSYQFLFYNGKYLFSIDGINIYLILLSSLATLISIIKSFESDILCAISNDITQLSQIQNREIVVDKFRYVSLFCILNTTISAFFSSENILMFYVLFEIIVAQMFVLIVLWGTKNSIRAAMKFAISSFIASIPMLAAIIYITMNIKSYDIEEIQYLLSRQYINISLPIIFSCFFLSFALKSTVPPFHFWLPDAHVEAPTCCSIMLAAVLLKMGSYGFIKILIPFFPDIINMLRIPLIIAFTIGGIYISILTVLQTNFKRIIAYSSISHMSFVHIGIFSGNPTGIIGGVIQMVSHGVISIGLFMIAGIVHEKLRTYDIRQMTGGLAKKTPIFAAISMFFFMASAGLPGTSGFVGEFYVIMSVYKISAILSYAIYLNLILICVYMLPMYSKTFFYKDKIHHYAVENASENRGAMAIDRDITASTKLAFTMLVIICIGIGLYPKIFQVIPLPRYINI